MDKYEKILGLVQSAMNSLDECYDELECVDNCAYCFARRECFEIMQLKKDIHDLYHEMCARNALNSTK